MKFIFMILGMALVTYLPRLLPALFMHKFHFPAWFQKWLRSIPYAALGALIFPGILQVAEDQPLVGIISGMAAVILAIFNSHIVIVMVGAILAAIAVQNLW